MRFFLATVILAVGLVNAGFTAVSARPVTGAATRAQSDDLPDGPGKKILQASCTACHDLTEVTKFKGFYTRDDWRDIVQTMIDYGAVVKPDDVTVLVDYLVANLGKK